MDALNSRMVPGEAARVTDVMRKIVGLGVRMVGLTTICVVLLTAVFVLYLERSDDAWYSCVRNADGSRKCRSTHLGHEITVPRGVFPSAHASRCFLPLMEENADLFRGKSVLDIGVGSGIISLYAALLGAERVVSTDINPAALETTRLNAAEIGVADLIETRLVSGNDISAYSVIQPGERFDFILSNPPYWLDLDTARNNASLDRGDLGFSIVRGLENHLAPGGIAILLYSTTFYHNAMVKFARYSGYEVRHHDPIVLHRPEARILFNSYLARLLEHEGIRADAFRFDAREAFGGRGDLLRKFGFFVHKVERSGFLLDVEPLLPGSGTGSHPGMIVIEHGAQDEAGG